MLLRQSIRSEDGLLEVILVVHVHTDVAQVLLPLVLGSLEEIFQLSLLALILTQ